MKYPHGAIYIIITIWTMQSHSPTRLFATLSPYAILSSISIEKEQSAREENRTHTFSVKFALPGCARPIISARQISRVPWNQYATATSRVQRRNMNTLDKPGRRPLMLCSLQTFIYFSLETIMVSSNVRSRRRETYQHTIVWLQFPKFTSAIYK